MVAKLTFPSDEAFLRWDLRRVERRLVPMWQKRDVHFIVMNLATLATIVLAKTAQRPVWIVTLAVAVMGAVLLFLAWQRRRMWEARRDEILDELVQLDSKEYGWVLYQRYLFYGGDRFLFHEHMEGRSG